MGVNFHDMGFIAGYKNSKWIQFIRNTPPTAPLFKKRGMDLRFNKI